ncbi:5,10-methylene-tetrahydrofolate dehydrogenase [Staphylococcus simiae]|uniref:5,10-methylene-tetrahydrofolate dehydrogenase n=1 Tax=Staphylococcus simiae TaxID=308354 RepID=UPI003D6CCC73
MAQKIIVGLVVAPGVTEKLGQQLTAELPDIFIDEIDSNISWETDLVVDPLTGFAETVDDIYNEITNYYQEKSWQYVIAITDLPMFVNGHVMALDINNEQGVAVISYPSFGWRPIKKRMTNTIVSIIRNVHQSNLADQDYDANNHIKHTMNKQFPLAKVTKAKQYLDETESKHTRYIANSSIMGMFRLISGMTFANNPLKMMISFSNIVAIAFTTGAFGMVFSTMWQLANEFSMIRLFSISVIAILGMLLWIVMAHQLWEPNNNSRHKRIIWLYNLTTIMTLLVAIIIYYCVLYMLFLTAEVILLPADFLGQQVKLGHAAGLDLYLSIPWFATSISTVAGAIGAGLLDDQRVKESTYGYRQRLRYNNKQHDL